MGVFSPLDSVAEGAKKPKYGPGIAFPFTKEDDADGAMYVWFIVCNAGLRYEYIPAKDFPESERFGEVTDPRAGDVAWWPNYVALYRGAEDSDERTPSNFSTAPGRLPQSAALPPPRFFRLRLFDGEFMKPSQNAGDRVSECMPDRR